MLHFFTHLFDTAGFSPRWYCGTWTTGHGWLHILADSAIFGAYVAIPCVLAYFILRRSDIPFPRILWLFVAFIFACGFGHLIEAIIFWQPVYRFAGLVKLSTAIVSWGTVIALFQIVPQALELPGLARLNQDLHKEVQQRNRVEMALRESEGKLAGLLASEREARNEAERANRMKDDFLSTASHELRTPLTAILGYAQLLQANVSEDERREGLQVIERNAKVQARLIDDLLDMSRIMSGKVRLDITPVDLTQVIRAALETVRPLAEAKRVQLQADLPPGDATVSGDSARLQQVVWNLLTNAVKFSSPAGTVRVELESHDSELELRVSDAGQGIAAEFLPHVFDRFRQADSSITRKHGGLGLGLSIVKSLIDLHGGAVEVTSAGLGQGATFTVRLPVLTVSHSSAPSDAKAPHRHVPANVSLAGIRLVVVDDEADSRELIKRLLLERGAEIRTAESTDEALSLIQKFQPDILLSDISMPGKDGFDLIRAVRALPPAQGGSIKAAAVSALARSEDRTRALLSGYQSHLAKPIDSSELIAVAAALAGRTAQLST